LASAKPAAKRTTARKRALPGHLRLVGIGASAGGLEALRDLIGQLPASDAYCYVIAQHLSPSHISMLANLLAPTTELKVQNLTARTAPRAGTIYVTTPNHDVIFEHGLLRLVRPPQAIGPKPSVNHLFLSMAHELGERAIGVILSGTGSDGAAGMRAIKAAGGVTIVQEPDTAKYDGMPQAAIATASVDLILPAEDIGPVLSRLATRTADIGAALLDETRGETDYHRVTSLVRLSTGFRLADYKASTIRRRIARRMGILGIEAMADYIAELHKDRKEAQALVRDTFISVTSFFRDEAAFVGLRQAIGDLVATRPDDSVIRCWVPACATGEEAYSIAMLLEEAIANAGRTRLDYIIFASDLDEAALEVARRGVYAAEAAASIPDHLRTAFAETSGDFVTMTKALRNRLIFARQNVIEDPPFARLDLVSCRNFLIYLNPPVQHAVMQVFHFALRPGGLLLLGKAENAEGHGDLFTVHNARARLYARGDGPGTYTMPASLGAADRHQAPRHQGEEGDPATRADPLTLRMLERLAQAFAPASLVVDASDKVLHFHGDLSPYLAFPQGPADLDLFDLLRAGPRAELRALVYRCRRSDPHVEGSAWNLDINGVRHAVTLVVSRLDPQRGDHILVSFRAVAAPESAPPADGLQSSDHDLIIAELEKELAHTRTHLNVVVEELETSNEELQSLNEELQSANEELQSSNEELQTSNEELQSSNEELLTVNEEIQIKSSEMQIIAQDLDNVKESISFPLFVVDRAMRITCYNRACATVADLARVETGKSLHEIAWRIEVPQIFERIADVQAHGEPWSQIVTAADGRVHTVYIMPYRAARQAIDGALLIYEDITELHRARQAIDRHLEDLRLLGNATANGVIAVDPAGLIRFANAAAETLFGYAAGAMVGLPVETLVPDGLREGHAALRAAAQLDDGEVHVMGPARNVLGRDRHGNLFPIDVQLRQSRSGPSADVVASIFDLRPRMAVEQTLREAKLAAEAANEAKSSFLAAMSHEIRTPMNVVLGILELLARSDIGAEQRGYLQQAEIATRALRRVIDDILDFSKVEADRMELEHAPFALADVVKALAGQMALTAGDRAIAFRVDLDPDIPPLVRGDPLRLHQILQNLVANAFKFTRKGQIVLAVRQTAAPAGTVPIEFSVSDTGIGIAEDSLEAIFEGFTQAESSTTRRFGGTGLGLAISRRLVELMGGRLDVESRLGVGSRFHFTLELPLVDPAMREAIIAPDDGAAPFMLASPRLAGTRVLLVEDFPMNRTLMLALLSAEGAEVTVASNGADAIALAQQADAAFDIVLMDVQMPVIDGFDAARALRAIEATRAIPILAITANALPADRARCLEAGMNDYVAKPIVLDDLVTRIARLLPPGPTEPVLTH